jgi:hypothetical protein
MSFVKITPDLLDVVSLELHPSYKYTSSSLGETGTVKVKPRPDKVLKDVYKPMSGSEGEDETGAVEEAPENLEYHLGELIISASAESLTDVGSMLGEYMTLVNTRDLSPRNDKDMGVFRFDPPFFFTENTEIKNIVRNNLMPSYNLDYDHCGFTFTNYNSLNFFTSDSVPSDSVLMFPTPPSSSEPILHGGRYVPDGAFSVDFYINPRYQNEDDSTEFKAGTILHLSSTLAVSLVSGSSVDENGKANGFRIMLQMGEDAERAPSTINPGLIGTYDKIFLSEDNSLKHNNWHHVCVRWGTNSVNMGSGSIRIDESSETYFNVDETTVTPLKTELGTAGKGDIDVLFIGNFYEGTNIDDHRTARFFWGDNPSAGSSPGFLIDDGLIWGDDATDLTPFYLGFSLVGGTMLDTRQEADEAEVFDWAFDHPLQAEIQELKLYSRYISTSEVDGFETTNPTPFNMSGSLMFYLPPTFAEETNQRQVLVSPFQAITSTTDDPFNVSLSFGAGGHMLNLENFTKEFRHGIHPRLFNLTGSTIDTTTIDVDDTAYSDPSADGSTTSSGSLANEFIYATGSLRKRNLSILPSDNGLFNPTYSHLTGYSQDKFKNQLGNTDISKVSINNLIPMNTLFPGLIQTSKSSLASQIMGTSPENPGVSPGSVLTIFQRTRDNSSNEITIFDISNLTYGNQIEPETFKLYDSALTGSGGKVSMILKDNGRGSLYRADCLTKQAEWNNVGNVFYEEGIAIVKAPTIPFFGIDQHELSFKGSQNLHIMTVDAKAKAGQVNKSTNPSYLPVSASLDANNPDNSFVYISGINYHDENLNVIMRTNLTQPIKKKDEDEYVFRTKMDW